MPLPEKDLTWVSATQFLIISIPSFGFFFVILLYFTITSPGSDFYIYVPFYIISLYIFIDTQQWLVTFHGGKRNIMYCENTILRKIKDNGISDQLSNNFKSVTILRNHSIMSLMFNTYYYYLDENPKKRILLIITNSKLIVFITSSCIEDSQKLSQMLQNIKDNRTS